MAEPSITLSEEGVRVPRNVAAGLREASCDVYFDGHHVWSFSLGERRAGAHDVLVAWPRVMHRWLDGVARVEVRAGDRSVYDAETRFGAGDGRIAFRDADGIPVMIDKWGLVQRPFTGRGETVVAEMVDLTERILAVMAEECGVRGWIAFGTLLGAARDGRAIGHDSDIDLAYLSRQPTPAAMAREMYSIGRALRRAGMRVMNKSGSFITVLFTASDGGQASIDIYTCFYVGDLLYETATVRAPVPPSAVEPLTTIRFEGRLLPAPADPDAMLVASYGPAWRTPDPSFRHQPGPEITRRFDPWFGSLMRNRRDWETHWREQPPPAAGEDLSDFAAWALGHLPAVAHVVDVGAGNGRDGLAMAERGVRVTGLDYARGSFRAAQRLVSEGMSATFRPMNLYDLRDVMAMAALLARELGPRAVAARGVAESVEPDGRQNLWRFVSMVLRPAGTLLVEYDADPGRRPVKLPSGGKRYPISTEEVTRQVESAGGVVREHAEVPRPSLPDEGRVRRWRLVADFGGEDSSGRGVQG